MPGGLVNGAKAVRGRVAEKCVRAHITVGKASSDLFLRFAPGGILDRFILFHEPGRQRPESFSGFDGAPAKQNFIASRDDRSGNNFRIHIIDKVAIIADSPRAIITFWYIQPEIR